MNDHSVRPAAAVPVLDDVISPAVRTMLEERYYLRVQQQAELARVIADPLFLERPSDHVALFADHGVAHVRDVATRTLQVLDAVHGVLIPRRPLHRLAFMRGLGVLLAYVHDIGMAEPGQQARAMHPEYVVQAALGPAFDDIVAGIMADDRGGVVPFLAGDTERMLRELLATAMAHSKSKVPTSMLTDGPRLRAALLDAARCDLGWLYTQQRRGQDPTADDRDHARPLASPTTTERLASEYADFSAEGFVWLDAADDWSRVLAEDVIDTVRVLRAADALRQRGTTLKTSGNNEIFIDQRNATAVFALRLDTQRLFLLEIADPTSAGEANLSSGELDPSGNLRICFHHGLFKDDDTIAFAAQCAARIVADIHSDTLGSFARPPAAAEDDIRPHLDAAEIHLEDVDDNPHFAAHVHTALARLDPDAARRVRVVPSLQLSTPEERARYLGGTAVAWDLSRRQALLRELADRGHRTDGIDLVAAFGHLREIVLYPTEVLVAAGTSACLVYIPLGEGLRGQPLGGYAPFDVPAWTPVGVTGVVRGAARNATIVAMQEVRLIAIPKDIYMAHWHRTYDVARFAALFAGGVSGTCGSSDASL